MQLCSISLVTGLFICLRSATKITHKAQSLTCLAAKWHVCATVHCFDDSDGETSTAQISTTRVFPVNAVWESDDDEEEGGDDLDNTKLVPIHEHAISFQKRQALGEWQQISPSSTFLVLFSSTHQIVDMYCSDIFRAQQSRSYCVRVHA